MQSGQESQVIHLTKKLEEYKTAFEELRDVMNNYQEFLKNAAEHYEQVENRLQEEAGNLRG